MRTLPTRCNQKLAASSCRLKLRSVDVARKSGHWSLVPWTVGCYGSKTISDVDGGRSSGGDGSCFHFTFRAFPEETGGRSNSGGGPHHLRDVCEQMFGDRGGRKRGHPQAQPQSSQPQITRHVVRPRKRRDSASL